VHQDKLKKLSESARTTKEATGSSHMKPIRCLNLVGRLRQAYYITVTDLSADFSLSLTLSLTK
jgi:hypothetical protein